MASLLPLVEASEEENVKLAHHYFERGDYIKALGVIEDSISISGREKISAILYFVGGKIFRQLAEKTNNSDVKFTFLLGSVECFLDDRGAHGLSATQLLDMAKQLDSAVYYRLAFKTANICLSFLANHDDLDLDEQITRSTLQNVVQVAESKIPLAVSVRNSETKLKDVLDKRRSDPHSSVVQRLRSSWVGLDVEKKRNFMKISTEKLSAYVERVYGSDGKEVLEQVLDFARKNRKWRFWICRTCSKKFLYLKEFKNHIEKQHAAKLKPSTIKNMAQKVDEGWARMISVAGWEPVDSVAAAEMIKTKLEFVKEIAYKNGWSSEWPVAADEKRSKLLNEIQLRLMTLWEHKVLSCSIRDWIMQFLVKHLAQFEVSEHTISTECRLMDTPQSICFLECHDLNQILNILKKIKCERDDGRDLICNAVDSFCGHTRVKEKIDFDDQFSFMLLDKRLLRNKIASFDDEGTIDVWDHKLFYAKTHPQGDDIITWLLDYPLLAESFKFPKSIRAYNLDIWVAVLRAIHFTCRTLRIKYEKKSTILDYDKALSDVLADSKILLVENSRINLLDDLTRLSVFDYRAYIMHLLKRLLREELGGIAFIEAKAKAAAAAEDLLSEEKQEKAKKSVSKKKKKKSNKPTPTSASSLLDPNVEHESSVNLELGIASLSLKVVEEDSMEPEDTISSQRGQLEISSKTDKQEDAAKEIDNRSGEDLMSEQLKTALEEGAVRSNLALEMTLKALCSIKVLKEYMMHTRDHLPANLDEKVSSAVQNFFVAFVSKQIKVEGVYTCLLRDLLASLDAVQSMSSDAAELLVSILECLHCWKFPESDSLVTHLFTLELYERMSCKNCRRKPNYPDQSSYGIVVDADSIRNYKCALEDIEFEKILKVIRMEHKMLCDTKTGGCGEANYVHNIMRRCPPIYAIVLQWKKNETEKEIYETIKALKWEIEMSRLYEGLGKQNRKYRLVSMVCCGVEEEYICLAYKKNQWFSFSQKALVKKPVGDWKSVVGFCGERKFRPEILFYEDFQWSSN